MYILQKLGSISSLRSNLKILTQCYICTNKLDRTIIQRSLQTSVLLKEQNTPRALRNVKPKSRANNLQYFVDMKQIRAIGGKGGDGDISFLSLYLNEYAGPAGGDGGNGGHVIFEVSENVKDLKHLKPVNQAENGENGRNDNCTGKNAKHLILRVPIGTIVRNIKGNVLADLSKPGMMFVASRGGGGGHGNTFFKTSVRQAPKISEYGAMGENNEYVLEVRSMAHIGLIGFPNAGKSTLLRTITRARPKVAAYPFTTLKPYLGTVEYEDYEQITVADLPGLIPDSHKNKGLGIQFLKHAERCAVLLYIIDVSLEDPWKQFEMLKFESSQFNKNLIQRPAIIVANKMDLPDAEQNLHMLKQKINLPIIPISAKYGTNIANLLSEIRIIYDKIVSEKTEEKKEQTC